MPTDECEFHTKISRLRTLLVQHQVDGILLRRTSSFAWATCGAASYVNAASTEGVASLLITPEDLFLITNNIEAPRLEQEEGLTRQGWQMLISPWENPLAELQRRTSGLRLVSDVCFENAQVIAGEISHLRSDLTPQEQDRFRELGRQCSQAISSAGRSIEPGMSELQITAIIAEKTQKKGIQPIVNLVATDDRIKQFRHPLPTNKILDKYAMLVLSGRRQGLVCSVTRLVYFGRVPDELQQRILATAEVNAALIGASMPGIQLSAVLEEGKKAYAHTGFPEEWRNHHQGGVAGYESREYLATSESKDVIRKGQALAWNPTIAGAKMEDTILVGENEIENLTYSADWPTIALEAPGTGRTVQCALALER